MSKTIAGMTQQEWYKLETDGAVKFAAFQDRIKQLDRNIRSAALSCTREDLDAMYLAAYLADDGHQLRILDTIFNELETAGVDTYGEIPIG